VNHPAWCSPALCVSDEAGVTHSSAPRELRLGDETLTLYLVQDHIAGGPPRATEVHVNSARSEHEWPVDGVCDLAAALTGMFHKSHLLRTSAAAS
jgi:hypothetical protein